jgi:hypothetical protein
MDDPYKFLRPDDVDDVFYSRMFPFDPDKLYKLLVMACCPIVCVGYVNEVGWHTRCEAKAKAALDILFKP